MTVIYAGTGALGGSSKVTFLKFTNNKELLQLKDASRSIVRTIQNNLMDTSKQVLKFKRNIIRINH